MKLTKILVLAAAALVLGSCGNNNPSSSSSSTSGSTSHSSSSTSSSTSHQTDSDWVETGSDSFPTSVVNAYRSEWGIVPTITGITGDSWAYIRLYDEGYYMCLESYDEGTPGVDSMEGDYCTILENAGWDIDDTDYEDYGYFATYGTDETVELQFFSYDGVFDLFITPLNQ